MFKKILSVILILLLFNHNLAFAGNIYYVLINGGPGGNTTTSCNGTQNVPFTGSNGPNCAFNHPNWVIPERNSVDYPDNPTTYAMVGGDTLIVGPGSYRFGYQGTATNPNHNYTVNMGTAAYAMGDIQPPSGTASDWTEIYGCSLTGCGTGAKPEFWVAGSANTLFTLTNRSYIHFMSIEMTDHHQGPYGNCRTLQDQGGYPGNSLCGKNAFTALGGWHHIRMTDMDVHGFGNTALFLSGSGPSGTPVETLFENSNFDGSAGPGYDADGCGNNGTCGITGNITFRKVNMRWSGCGEAYPPVWGPGVSGRVPMTDGCTGQGTGGYGDGLATSDTGGNWLFEDSNLSHSTEDMIDLLYMGRTDRANYGPVSFIVRRSLFEGNSGAAVKGPIDLLEDNIIIGNCPWWAGPLGLTYTPPGYAICRAQGTPISHVAKDATAMRMYGNTILSNGDNSVLVDSSRQAAGNNGVCNFDTKNNIFIGGYGHMQDAVAMFDAYDSAGQQSCLGGLNRGMNNNICYGVFKPGAGGIAGCTGPNDLNNVNPQFIGALEQGSGEYQTAGFYSGVEYAQRLYLQASSPAIGAGSATYGDNLDFNSFVRSAPPAIGALEFGSVAPGACSPTGNSCVQSNQCCSGTCFATTCVDTAPTLPTTFTFKGGLRGNLGR